MTDQTSTKQTDAVPHVGRTLESEEIFGDVLGRELPTADAGEASIDGLTIVNVLPNGEPGSEETSEADTTEPLKTRLPGDTSSDPHTDLP